MAFCSNCGKQLIENAAFCPSCGAKVQYTANTSSQSQAPQPPAPVAQPQAQQSPQQPYSQPQYAGQASYAGQPAAPVDSGSFGWAVLGFFIPIVGLVLYLVWKSERPRSAKNAGMGALVSVIMTVLIWLISLMVSCSMLYAIS